jgi:antitoxin Phd
MLPVAARWVLGGFLQGMQVFSAHAMTPEDKLVSDLVTKDATMNTWPVQDAKARFSEFLEKCLTEGPQMVTKRGAEAAVLVPAQDWWRLQASARPSLKELLLWPETKTTALTPARQRARRRTPTALR